MLGDKVKYLRGMKDMQQAELAKAVGVSAATIGLIEQNRRKPSVEVLERLADALGTTTDYLLGRTELVDNILTREELEKILGPGDYPAWIELKEYIDKAKLKPQQVKAMLEDIMEAVKRQQS